MCWAKGGGKEHQGQRQKKRKQLKKKKKRKSKAHLKKPLMMRRMKALLHPSISTMQL